MNLLAITEIERNNKSFISYITLDDNREFVDFQLFDASNSIVDCIYIARVENIVKNINAAFVSISDSQKCYLSLENFSDCVYVKKQSQTKELSIGDYILVQVIKDAVKTKDPVVSEKLSLHGKYCLLTSGNKSFGQSKKIPKDKQLQGQEVLNIIKKENENASFGIVLRTDSIQATKDELLNDIKAVIDQFEYITKVQVHHSLHSLIYKGTSGYISRIKATSFDHIDSITTDSREIYEQIKLELPAIYFDKVHFYNDKQVSLKTLYNVEGNIDKLISNKVWLKSGANIIIEQLETITFIDVNTAKNITKNKHVILDVNKEAALEISRQLRLRNISGMIIIDFINMESEEDRNELISFLRLEIKKDLVPCQFMDYTKLGLIELTRKKKYSSLKETISLVN